MDGVLVIDKPKGPTSHDVVQAVRRHFKVKAGHTGTLDPAASGVLPVVLGQATRLARFLQASDKTYLAWIVLGIETDSFDLQGTVTSRRQVPEISAQQVEETLKRFRGEITQRPPLFSAIRVKGERLYKVARRGGQSSIPVRRVRIDELRLMEQESQRWLLKVRCSSGTYIRSLAHDIGEFLSCGASLAELRRIRSGQFGLEAAISLEEMAWDWERAWVPMEQLLVEWPSAELDPESAVRVSHGNVLPWKSDAGEGHWRLFYRGDLLAIAEYSHQALHPRLVFSISGEG